MHHLSTNPDTDEMDCLQKKCYQIRVKYGMDMNMWYEDRQYTYECE